MNPSTPHPQRRRLTRAELRRRRRRRAIRRVAGLTLMLCVAAGGVSFLLTRRAAIPSASAACAGPQPAPRAPPGYAHSLEQDKELQAIFERTYGPVKRRDFQPQARPPRRETEEAGEKRSIRPPDLGPEYLLVDGYNIIFAWEDLKAVARDSLDAARQLLMDLLSNYQGFRKCEVILVFDAYKVKGGVGSVERRGGIYVVYTKEAETADQYIEKVAIRIGRRYRTTVATSDGVIQLIIRSQGCILWSARDFREEIERVGKLISEEKGKHTGNAKNYLFAHADEETQKYLEAVRLGKNPEMP